MSKNYLKNHKAFTLLEMLIVVIIGALMIGTFGYFMPKDNQDDQQKFGIEAAIDIYNHIKTSHNKLIRNHTEQFGSTTKTIEYITINSTATIATGIKIKETYSKNDGYNIEKNLEYSNKNFKNTINKLGVKAVTIDNNNKFNEDRTIETQICNLNLKNCMPISQIKFNKAAQTISQYFCLELLYTEGKGYKCTLRETSSNSSSSSGSSVDLGGGGGKL